MDELWAYTIYSPVTFKCYRAEPISTHIKLQTTKWYIVIIIH